MIYPSILERRYLEYLPFVEQVASRVKDTIINFCEKNGYASTYRIKTIESLAEKIETGRFEKWSDLDDLFGCTDRTYLLLMLDGSGCWVSARQPNRQ